MKKRKHLLFLFLLLAAVVLVAALLPPQLKRLEKNAYPLHYEALVERYAAANGLEPAFIYAVIKTESGFRPAATSGVGARGLMQIMPDAFSWLAQKQRDTESDFDDMYDPETNIRYGCYLLGMLMDEFASLRSAAAGYHAGPGAVRKWLADPDCSTDGTTLTRIPSSATGHYVEKVLRNYRQYCRIYGF